MIWLTSFGDFIKKVFNVGKRKSEQIEMDFGAPLTTYKTIKSASLDHLFTSRACGNIMEYLPDVPKEGAEDDDSYEWLDNDPEDTQ